ncbi:MAG: DEAD/DEAH box helicase [Chloroflexi bacterium]|nr:DEAD/DEAH box helicase [Chloroflexota bacterium]MBI3040061.1 DEAD/DEAH box helicase [Chloroflexota bacterium]MBI3930846.1 DEAD/DEAH box helicase [Chloroflexota bacterium]
MNFENLNLHPAIMRGVHELGYTELTPIQAEAIPLILRGKDVIGLAQTGTGKTAAFVLPILEHLLKSPRRQIGAVIITPTRELAEQINAAINTLGKYTGLKSIAVYGGTNVEAQVRDLNKSVEIVVACPGRLLDHLWRGSIDLSNVEILVIDEADRMFDMGFLPDIRKILQCLLKSRQTLLFSATMPEDIRKLVKDVLNNPVTVQIGKTAPAVTVSHSLYPVKQHLKTELLMELLHGLESKSVLIFTRTKHRTERVARSLKSAGFRVASLQGDLTQTRRQAALDAFRKGTIKILVATDILARGIDVLHISHVINYDMPANTDDYIHRIGRTGRVNKNGDALTFVTDTDTDMVNSIERILKKKIERRRLGNFDYTRSAPPQTDTRRNSRRSNNSLFPQRQLSLSTRLSNITKAPLVKRWT